MLITFIKGLGVGSGLIIAIGAQNAFVLSQGVRKSHYLIIPAICSFCDAALIILGVSGVGTIVAMNPLLSNIAAFGGALFLFWYGLSSFRAAFKESSLEITDESKISLKAAILTTIGVTLLNPHVYLDTVVLVGSISAQFNDKYIFGAGAASASFIWFFSLSLCGKKLAPLFKKPGAWKILDGFVGITMWWIAVTLIIGVL
ncbi:MAG: amino acid transporter [Desulfobacterales bacterium]|nr:amino acid transporter [Desulfobacterales bacterium]